MNKVRMRKMHFLYASYA